MSTRAPFRTLSTDDEAHAKFCGVILLDESIEPVFEEIRFGWKITLGKTTVYINHRADGKVIHRNCLNQMDDILTDAEILAVKDGRYGVVNASIVRRGGESLLEVYARVNGWVDRAAQDGQIFPRP